MFSIFQANNSMQQYSANQSIKINSSPNNKILDQSKIQALADSKINMNKKLKFVFGRVENIVAKGENAGYQHFPFFPQCFQKASYSGSFKVVIVW